MGRYVYPRESCWRLSRARAPPIRRMFGGSGRWSTVGERSAWGSGRWSTVGERSALGAGDGGPPSANAAHWGSGRWSTVGERNALGGDVVNHGVLVYWIETQRGTNVPTDTRAPIRARKCVRRRH